MLAYIYIYRICFLYVALNTSQANVFCMSHSILHKQILSQLGETSVQGLPVTYTTMYI